MRLGGHRDYLGHAIGHIQITSETSERLKTIQLMNNISSSLPVCGSPSVHKWSQAAASLLLAAVWETDSGSTGVEGNGRAERSTKTLHECLSCTLYFKAEATVGLLKKKQKTLDFILPSPQDFFCYVKSRILSSILSLCPVWWILFYFLFCQQLIPDLNLLHWSLFSF